MKVEPFKSSIKGTNTEKMQNSWPTFKNKYSSFEQEPCESIHWQQ